MRIAFVGKGGAGKTSLCVLFSQYLKQDRRDVLVVDADINTHVQGLLGFCPIPDEKHLSHPEATSFIRKYLKGQNNRIASDGAFRKTTPPASGSNLIFIDDKDNSILGRYSVANDNLRLMVVGTYHEDDIGATCYHNHLATFENILTHLIDDRGVLVADMVAGVDAFASTLHAQFDLMVLAVEPTWRSIEVYDQYAALAQSASCLDSLVVVGNKIRSSEDVDFIKNRIPHESILGFFTDSDYLRVQDKECAVLDCKQLEQGNLATLHNIKEALFARPFDPQKRMKRIWELHKKYVAQLSIRERFGDLTNQIDENFDMTRASEHLRVRKD